MPGEVYLGVPHRLDRPATGVIIFAKDHRTTRKLGAQFENRRVHKVYWACIEGHVAAETGRWEDFLYKVAGEPRAEVVGAGHPEGRHAALHYRVLKTFDWGDWLEIELETGRTHQIRVQAASRGHPVLGDKQYGSTVAFGPQFEDERLQAIALHARSLTLPRPGNPPDGDGGGAGGRLLAGIGVECHDAREMGLFSLNSLSLRGLVAGSSLSARPALQISTSAATIVDAVVEEDCANERVVP